ncbi:MAG TPA: RagB/SusD family nutrient uptake outer membrane protein, partial [Paludibacter sp.]|nr:RagB/SusD family nutrient uptake outer membrane protein [Paludibacter sp.]
KSKLASDIGLTEPWTKESFRSYILEERAKEFGEEGHRRFDLIRWGIYLQTMNAIGGADENGVLKRREKRHLLLPLPADEVNTNEHIDVNNPGW